MVGGPGETTPASTEGTDSAWHAGVQPALGGERPYAVPNPGLAPGWRMEDVRIQCSASMHTVQTGRGACVLEGVTFFLFPRSQAGTRSFSSSSPV